MSETQLITLKLLIWLLQSQKQVKIERLAATLPLPIQQNSRRRHIQRFLSLNQLSVVLNKVSLNSTDNDSTHRQRKTTDYRLR